MTLSDNSTPPSWQTQTPPSLGTKGPSVPPNEDQDKVDKPASQIEQDASSTPEQSAEDERQVTSVVAGAVERAVKEAASERWNRVASWVLFVGGIALIVLWTTLVLMLPDAQMPASSPVVITGMIVGAVGAVAGGTLLMVASFKPAVGIQAAVDALEARKQLERMTAEIEVAKLEVEIKQRQQKDLELQRGDGLTSTR